ncbi:LacI family transcriptional regulator [Salinicola sp. MH3R3-1]|uniref:LacI family DNA-binding transcriptional regulator n=1 Tax=Salinicola sp. MH3R3-1 TaxID=1928762 RepID=UPI00094E34E1|nr:LacI family DNA-binding transcriptional regulator [Salinicola sp. MH3R3-1]OLO08381.1 LacI family transcriptional regulator [Salinicola sp. MH3R3-1]
MSFTPRPSLVQIAEQTGVSPATVSRAFNRPEMLSDATRKRILATAKRLGFRPNRIGSSLRSGSTKTLGLLLPTMSNPVFAACFEGAEARALEAGYSVMLATTGYDSQRERTAARSLLDHRVDGLILTVSDPSTSATLDELTASDVPFVLAYNESDSHPFVSVDNHAAAGDMVEYLVACGHRQLAMISGPLDASDRASKRLDGVLDRAATLGLPAPIHVSMPQHTAADRGRLKSLMASPEPPTALFCSNDLLATAVIAELSSLSLRVPRDLSVCGFDGMAFGALMVPSLASVHQPSFEIGSQACQELLSALGGEGSRSLRLPHRLFGGDTVASLSHQAVQPSHCHS